MAELKRSPLHDRHVALGAKFAEFGGWSMPLQYAGIVSEHKAVREAVGIFDVSHLGKARITGPGAADFLNACITNDIAKIGVGQAQYTLLCNADGGVVDDLIWYWLADDEIFLIPNAANTAEVVAQARAGVLQAGAPPNPLVYGTFTKAFDYDPNDPTTCPPGSGCSDLGFAAGLSDQALWDLVSGKRGLRLKTACAALLAAQLNRQDLERSLIARLKQQLLQVALFQRLVDFSQEVTHTADRTTELTRQRFSSGAASEVELAKAETEGFAALSALERARSELRLRQIDLAYLLGAREAVPPFVVTLELSGAGATTAEVATDAAARTRAPSVAVSSCTSCYSSCPIWRPRSGLVPPTG